MEYPSEAEKGIEQGSSVDRLAGALTREENEALEAILACCRYARRVVEASKEDSGGDAPCS